VISDGMECLRVKTETTYLKRRAIKALRSVADFLESKLDAAEVTFGSPDGAPCMEIAKFHLSPSITATRCV